MEVQFNKDNIKSTHPIRTLVLDFYSRRRDVGQEAEDLAHTVEDWQDLDSVDSFSLGEGLDRT